MSWSHLLAKQLSAPTGIFGKWVAFFMTQKNALLHDWTITKMNLEPDDYLLEIGFGTGSTIKKVAKKAHHGKIFGLDASPTMVQTASRKNHDSIQKGQVILQQGDVLELPFENDKFDRVYSIHAFYFWKQPIDCLNQIYRVLKHNGMVILSLEKKESMIQRRITTEPSFTHYEEQEIIQMFQAVGFCKVTVSEFPEAAAFCIIGIKNKMNMVE